MPSRSNAAGLKEDRIRGSWGLSEIGELLLGDGGKAVKEIPILFRPEMVRAILEGRKTQTRRVLKDKWYQKHGLSTLQLPAENCPYGVPGGMRLWVRETWTPGYTHNADDENEDDSYCEIIYKADMQHHRCKTSYSIADKYYRMYSEDDVGDPKWKPSIHMPRWASRITLEVKSVRVERLQDITSDDCDKEIFGGDFPHNIMPELFGIDEAPGYSIPECFARVWDSINGKKYPWSMNPWVFVIEFKRIKT